MTQEPEYTNRLIKEKSPYLLQHAHNPVDWYPWGEEAFSAAKREDKPIFLSIGYATCHWCHAMEKESFESEGLAMQLNRAFICVKVDRKEHPEVDSLYMEFAQNMMSGAAGWPLNILLTPKLQPFFAATYLPPQTMHGMLGLNELIEKVEEIWKSDARLQIVEQAQKVVEFFAQNVHLSGDALPSEQKIKDTAQLFYRMTDPVYGGWQGAPKFPLGFQSIFLLHYASFYGDNRALFLVERTLDRMHRGGIYDHVGGGFHRYSVDERWLIPHFEKMLYDNALLAHAYLEAWRHTLCDDYLLICREVLDYLLRDMRGPHERGFYSAQDADSEGGEGGVYLFTKREILQALGVEDGEPFCQYYGITEEGNFQGQNVLHMPLSLEEFAQKKGDPIGLMRAWLGQQRERLWRIRERRPHPFKDDKILTSWNGLAIRSLAEAGAAFGETHYLQAAQDAAKFLQATMWDGRQLLHRFRDGEGGVNGGLDDYAFLISGLISLFEIDGNGGWLRWALELSEKAERLFKSAGGAFYQTDGADPHLILRKVSFSDGSEPSGNAVHCENLLRLYRLAGRTHFLMQAEDILKSVKKFLDSYGPAYCYHAANLIRYYDPKAATIQIVFNRPLA